MNKDKNNVFVYLTILFGIIILALIIFHVSDIGKNAKAEYGARIMYSNQILPTIGGIYDAESLVIGCGNEINSCTFECKRGRDNITFGCQSEALACVRDELIFKQRSFDDCISGCNTIVYNNCIIAPKQMIEDSARNLTNIAQFLRS